MYNIIMILFFIRKLLYAMAIVVDLFKFFIFGNFNALTLQVFPNQFRVLNQIYNRQNMKNTIYLNKGCL